MTVRGTRAAPTAPVAPAMIGPDNCVATLGMSWREALHVVRELGVPVAQVGARQLISARALVEALERRVEAAQPERELDPEAVVLARLGRRTA